MPAELTVIHAHHYRRVRWRNGLGWTREVLRSPNADGDDDWDWRISIAEIEADAAFSSFPGIERELVLLNGNGVRLEFDDGELHDVLPPHGRLRFDGARSVYGRLIDGPTHDFNLMWRRERIDAELWHRPLVGSVVLFAEPGEDWLVYVLSGSARCHGNARQGDAAMGDTLHLQAHEARARFALDGAGEALMIRLRRRDHQVASADAGFRID